MIFDSILTSMFLGTPAWFWIAFLAIFVVILLFDLGLLNRGHRELSISQSIRYSAVYISLALLFGLWVWFEKGSHHALDFYSGYLVEYSLSLDNIFMMSLIFGYFKIPRRYQHRVLFWGIIGVIVMRGIMITAGTAILHEYEWVLLLFGGFLIFTGIKMLLGGEEDEDSIENSRIVAFLEKHLRITRLMEDHRFILYVDSPKHGRKTGYATPLLLALITIELVDVIFAVDSIPAVFAITTDTFIVYTSNLFAVLGLRALYFLLAAMVNQFRYLNPAISIVLVFIGCKVFYAYFISDFSSAISLGVTVTVLTAGLLLSILMPEKEGEDKEENGGR